MKIAYRILAFVALVALLFSCKGKGATLSDTADLSPYLTADGKITLTAGDVSFNLIPVAPGLFLMGETFEQVVKMNPDIH